MLFNSFVFLLAFLPAALLLHAAAERYRPQARLPLLVGLSFVFYAWWDWRFLPLLLASIGVNWLVARALPRDRTGWLFPVALAGNLAVLGAFKYLGFLTDLADMIPGIDLPRIDLALPLGISFFTFHHIMYLTDLRAGRAPGFGLTRYALYIAFFPQVLAGPLVRWSEIMHQFEERPYARPDAAERIGRRSASPSRSISTFPATPTWRSASRCCSGSCCRRISTCPTAPPRCATSGGAGT